MNDGYYAHNTIRNIKSIKLIEEIALPFYTYDRYGHYLLECLPKLWIAKYGYKPKLVLPNSMKQVPDYLVSMVKPFGLDKNSFVFPGDVTFYSKLLMTTSPVMNGRYYSSAAKDVFMHVADYYVREKDEMTPELIYIARSESYGRTLVESRECEELFKNFGFTMIYPENYSFPEQVRLFAKATHIAGVACSGLHNVVFSKKPGKIKVLPIMPRDFESIRGYTKLDASFGRKSYCFFGSKMQTDASNRQTWSLDLNDLEYAVNQWLAD